MAKKTIRIDPETMLKEDYDITIRRDIDDVEWVAPAGAINLVVEFYYPHKQLSPISSSKSLKRLFPKTGHVGVKQIKYKIQVEYASGILTIDPFVIIQP